MTAKNNKEIPAKTKKLIFQEANSSCAFCEELDVNVLEIHHIENRAEGGGNEPENLILVCANCHSKITEGAISIYAVFRAKLRLQSNRAKPKKESTVPSNVIKFDRSINAGVVASNLQINTSKSVKIQPPIGTISSDRDKRNYTKHLIDRYNEFKKADRTIGDFRYSVIYQRIKRKFKCKWDFDNDIKNAYFRYRLLVCYGL